ncbi:MAG: sulfide-dependent adenosine diphosphate thiazole synthase [Thermosulfidibacteraceae bacterium]
MLDEKIITRAIMEEYFSKFDSVIRSDVAIVGAGPSGLVCGYYLAKDGYNVAVFERKLAPGGGIWGGGAMFNVVVVQEDAVSILDEFDIPYKPYREKGYYIVDAITLASGLIYKATKMGVKIFNLISAVDVKVTGDDERVCGLVLSWTPVELSKLHVDPITVEADVVVDGTGHDAEVAGIVAKKLKRKLRTPTGEVIGEKPMHAEFGEKFVVERTGEVYPGLFVIGMAATACYGEHRMGPIFGGMLLSGRKASQMIKEVLKVKR